MEQVAHYPFTYVQGNAPETEPGRQITIGSWNICGTSRSPKYGGVVHWEDRLPQMIDKVRKADPDIMVFQEVYESDLSNQLVEGLKDRYPHFFTHLGPNSFGVESGCMLLSKHPIHSFSHTSFSNTSTFLATKRGYSILEIKESEEATSPILRIVGTHILYGSDAESLAKQEEQVNQLKQHLESLPLCPSLIAADFNIERNHPLLSFLKHGYDGKEATCRTTSLVQQWKPSAEGPPEEWIDNISLLKDSPGKIETSLIYAFDPSAPNSREALSDHHFLFGTYTFES